jgi:molecular chaperone DnaJ
MLARARRDYYAVLGVPRGADRGTIKKAFRALATEFHPDVSDDPDAERRFRELVEAYEVLSRPESRARYDRFGHERRESFRPPASGGVDRLFDDLLERAATAPRPGQRGADVVVTAEISLLDAARGTMRGVRYTAVGPCPACSGEGTGDVSARRTCTACNGTGSVRQAVAREPRPGFQYRACDRCRGTGRIVVNPCAECTGAGRIEEERTQLLVVRPGSRDGAILRLPGQGHAGGRAAEAGDLVVRLRVVGPPDSALLRRVALLGVGCGIGLLVAVVLVLY